MICCGWNRYWSSTFNQYLFCIKICFKIICIILNQSRHGTLTTILSYEYFANESVTSNSVSLTSVSVRKRSKCSFNWSKSSQTWRMFFRAPKTSVTLLNSLCHWSFAVITRVFKESLMLSSFLLILWKLEFTECSTWISSWKQWTNSWNNNEKCYNRFIWVNTFLYLRLKYK